MLVSIALRNLVELTSMELDFSSDGAILPQAFQFFRSKNIVWTIFFVRIFMWRWSTGTADNSLYTSPSLR
jgi:hypothetical protein